jgi:hypothetical protein
MPGPGKTFESFQADKVFCKAFASEQVQGQADTSNKRAVGTALSTGRLGAATGGLVGSAGAAVGATAGVGAGSTSGRSSSENDQLGIQRQYNNAFSQCMYSQHDQVPGFTPAMAYPPGPRYASVLPDPLVRATQSELIRLGYMRGGTDGYVGPHTRNAIASFEQANGLPPDGSPSRHLLTRLQSTPISAPVVTQSTPPRAPVVTSIPAATTASATSNWVSPTTGSSTRTPAAPSVHAPAWVPLK